MIKHSAKGQVLPNLSDFSKNFPTQHWKGWGKRKLTHRLTDGSVSCRTGRLRSSVEARVCSWAVRWEVRGHIVPSEHLLWSSADNAASSRLHSILGVKRNYTCGGFSAFC